MRYSLLLALALLSGAASVVAQSSALRNFEVVNPMDRSNLKFVIQALGDLDPDIEVFHSDDMRILQVKANPSVSNDELRAAINSTGLELRTGEVDLSRYTEAPVGEQPPIFVVTGDEQGDLARYQAAVATWNAAHPERQYATVPLHLQNR